MALKEHNKRVLASLEVGDRVKFPRFGYSHWGLFLGEENIIHCGGKKSDKGTVRIDNFWDVVGQGTAERNNDRDADWRPRSKEEIIKEAHLVLGKGDYDVFTENCEQFVNRCRYEMHDSSQVNRFITGLTICGACAMIPITIAATAPVENDMKKTPKRKLENLAMITGAALGLAADVKLTNEAKKRKKTVEYKLLKRVGCIATGGALGWGAVTALKMINKSQE